MYSALCPLYPIMFRLMNGAMGTIFILALVRKRPNRRNTVSIREASRNIGLVFPQQYSSLQRISSGRCSQSFLWLLMKEIIAMLYQQVWIVGRIEWHLMSCQGTKETKENERVLLRELLKSSLCWCLWF